MTSFTLSNPEGKPGRIDIDELKKGIEAIRNLKPNPRIMGALVSDREDMLEIGMQPGFGLWGFPLVITPVVPKNEIHLHMNDGTIKILKIKDL